jgi:hypothetical protein
LGGDLSVESSDNIFTEGFVGAVVVIRFGLSVLEGVQNFVDGGLNFSDGEVAVHGQEIQNGGSEFGGFHLSKDCSGVNLGVLVLVIASIGTSDQSDDAKSSNLSHN